MSLGLGVAPQADNTVELLRAFVDQVHDYAVVLFDPAGRIVSWNTGAQRIFGYSPEEILGRDSSCLYTDDDVAAGKPGRELDIAGDLGRFEAVGTKVRKDGSHLFVTVVTSPIRDARGTLSGFGQIIRSIAERRNDETQREPLREAQKLEDIRNLTGGIAHDLNNILTVVIGNLDLVAEKMKPDDKTKVFLTNSINAALHGKEVTKRFLAFGSRPALKPKLVSLNDLVRQFAIQAQQMLGERVTITVLPEGGLWQVFADPAQIEDALLNLSVNARDAMPEGGRLVFETKNVTLDMAYTALNPDATPGQYVLVAISDTGIGMTREAAAQAFEPLLATHRIGRRLDLSTVSGFVKQSGGHIEIQSEPGLGTSIRIYLPRADGIVEATPPNNPIARPHHAGDTRSVLIVEDNPGVLKLTSATVKGLGFTVFTASNGPDALQILAEHPGIDLLLTDVSLPGTTTGPVLAQRAVKMQPQIRVLFNSGYAEKEMFEKGLLAQGIDLISKPFTKQQLATKIEEVLAS